MDPSQEPGPFTAAGRYRSRGLLDRAEIRDCRASCLVRKKVGRKTRRAAREGAGRPEGSIYSFSPLTWSFTRRQCVGYDHR
jgi:hypothetical protein